MRSLEANEELQTLEAIYGDDVLVHADTVTVLLGEPIDRDAPSPALRCHLPEEYPGSAPPIAELVDLDFLAADTHNAMLSMFVPGEVVIFQWVELLRERLSDHHAAVRCASGPNAVTAAMPKASTPSALNDESAADDWLRSSGGETEEPYAGPTVYATLLQIDHMNDRKGSVSPHSCAARRSLRWTELRCVAS